MLREPRWLSRESIDAVHEVLIDQYGGSHGIRDAGLIDSALSRPLNRFAYAGPDCDLADLAATYGFGLVKNHGYIDGNKRVGFAALVLFLRKNGFRLRVTSAEAVPVIEQVAAGAVAEDQLAAWIRPHLEQVDRIK